MRGQGDEGTGLTLPSECVSLNRLVLGKIPW
jgi:hypothetical protein